MMYRNTRVYVAGAYSSNNVLGVLENMRLGMRASKDVMLARLAPFCPWLDYHFWLMLDDGETLTVDDFYEYSMAWLAASDAVLVVNNPANIDSVGLKKELDLARQLRIPIFNTVERLKDWDDAKRGEELFG